MYKGTFLGPRKFDIKRRITFTFKADILKDCSLSGQYILYFKKFVKEPILEANENRKKCLVDEKDK